MNTPIVVARLELVLVSCQLFPIYFINFLSFPPWLLVNLVGNIALLGPEIGRGQCLVSYQIEEFSCTYLVLKVIFFFLPHSVSE